MWVSATKQASHTLKLSTAWVSATKQASHTHKLSTAWVSATKQASHTHKFSTAWVSATKQASHTLKLFHAEAEEGYRLACSYLLCPHCGRIKSTEKLAPITCAHTVAE